MEELRIKTRKQIELIDITTQVAAAVKSSGSTNGVCTVFVPHTTAAVTINENADPDVVRDMIMTLDRVVPLQGGYAHMEGNSAAHIKASMMGASCSVIIEGGTLRLGTWQSIFFCEFDGPRSRKAWVRVA